ncbi:probable cytochrome P450 6a13 [Phlebotomus argentipes]|uniref:probable cytochrome P450 6a13 n=1 Tax=Phlebotomus argentipes TaxID=94469 RepID=UPI002893500C|nr:probable cytochrome P450 6a13 [Phlebotomus argentipes]
MFLILVSVISALVFLWQKWIFAFWRRSGVPGPSPSLFGGNLGSVIAQREHIGILTNKWYNDYSKVPYIGYYKVFKPAIMVRDVELLKNVLVNDYAYFAANDFASNDTTPFLQYDESKWKVGRTVASHMFTTARLKAIFSRMQRTGEKLIEYITEQGEDADIEAKSVTVKASIESLVSCLFSTDANCFSDPNNEFYSMGKTFLKPSFWLGLRYTLIYHLPFFSNLTFHRKNIEEWGTKVAMDEIKSRESENNDSEDFLQAMLKIKDKYKVSHSYIADQAFGFFIDGYETSSTTMAFALWHLARNEDIQQRLFEEIDVISSKYENTLSYEALSEMEYLEMVIHETMRLKTVGLTMHRICTKPYELPKLPGQKKPFVVQPGTPVLIPVYAFHHDPAIYPDPETFNPLRFTREERLKRPKCSYLGFGEGPRICVGVRFGMLQVKFVLATIVKNFLIKESPNCKPFTLDARSIFLTQSRDGLLLRFQRRE